MMAAEHYSVMLEEAVTALALGGAERVVDATFGGGGHARGILRELGPHGALLGVDRDPEAAARAAALAGEDRRFTFRPGAYDEVLEGLVVEGEKVDAVLFDLVSPAIRSTRLDGALATSGRGRWTCGWTRSAGRRRRTS